MIRLVAVAFLLASGPLASGQVRKVIKDFPHAVDCVAFSPDGKILATGTHVSDEGKDALRFWDVETGKEICSLKHEETFGCGPLAFAPDGKTLVVTNYHRESSISFWDVATRKVRLTLKGKKGFGICLAISPDSRTLAAIDSGVMRLYEMDTGRERMSLEGIYRAHAVVFSRDGKLIAASADKGGVILWDADTGKERAFLKKHTDAVNSVAFSPDSKTLYSVGQDRRLVHWDIATGKERKTIEFEEGCQSRYAALSPDGMTLAILGGGWLRLYDLARGEFWQEAQWKNQGGSQRCVTFSPDGKQVISGSGGNPARNCVFIYDVPNRKIRPRD